MIDTPSHLLRWSCIAALLLMVAGCSNAPAPSTAEATKLSTATPAEPEKPKEPITPDLVRQRLELAIEHVRARDLQTTNAFWTVFHGMLGLGPNTPLVDPKSGTRVPALKYVFGGEFPFGEIRGARFVPTAEGLDVTIGPVHVGQGHQDQFIAEMAQWGVKKDTPVRVFGKDYTMMDFVRETMAHSRLAGQELSWSIVVIATYIGTDAEWTNRFGEKLKFEDLLQSEYKVDANVQACGGTHHLFGLTWCYYTHLRSGGNVEQGIWKDVKKKLDEHVEIAKKYQNPDGSFSSNYFRGPGTTPDLESRLGSSGHTLEWLATHLPDEQLTEPWLQEAAMAVSLMILDSKAMPIESGALYHATHGLSTYHHRVYKHPIAAKELPVENDVEKK
jgi:hypothetical protein